MREASSLKKIPNYILEDKKKIPNYILSELCKVDTGFVNSGS